MRWSTISTVVVADQPNHFAFEVDRSGMRWGYRLDGGGTTTRVSEYREQVASQPWSTRLAYSMRLLGRDPDAIVQRGMYETLGRLKAGAETAPA